MSPTLSIMIQIHSAPSVEEKELETKNRRKRDWTRTVIQSLCCLLGSDNIISLSLYTSSEHDVLNCMVNLTGESILSLVSKLKNEGGVLPTPWRVYEPLKNAIDMLTTSVNTQHILVCNAMTPTVEREEDFNRWYNEEHILLLSKAPTWMQSMRYRLIDSNHDAPSYLAMHKWESRAAFESAEYEIATATPWKFRVVDNVIARERHVYDYVGEMHVGVGGMGVEEGLNQSLSK